MVFLYVCIVLKNLVAYHSHRALVLLLVHVLILEIKRHLLCLALLLDWSLANEVHELQARFLLQGCVITLGVRVESAALSSFVPSHNQLNWQLTFILLDLLSNSLQTLLESGILDLLGVHSPLLLSLNLLLLITKFLRPNLFSQIFQFNNSSLPPKYFGVLAIRSLATALLQSPDVDRLRLVLGRTLPRHLLLVLSSVGLCRHFEHFNPAHVDGLSLLRGRRQIRSVGRLPKLLD